VSGARLLLDRAASSGNAQAKFALAETYDPLVLAAMNARGIRPDADKARQLYLEALSGGAAEAQSRLDTLSAR